MVRGADVVAENIVAFGGRFLQEVDTDMEAVRGLLDAQVGQNIGLRDHSLGDLRAMGHPYASRAPQAIHDPVWQVHSQSGQLLAGKYSGTDKAAVSGGNLNARAFVGVSEQVPHAAPVIFGTSKMVPRDFLGGSLDQVAPRAMDVLSRSLAGVVLNFNGKKVKL